MNRKLKLLLQADLSHSGRSGRSQSHFAKLGLLLIASFFALASVHAQATLPITGIVSSSTETLVGASVVEKGTTNGTMTDIEGRFELKVKPGASIEVSFMGYKTQLLTVDTKSEFKITLLPDESIMLDEVVAIGYGVQKKKLNTGATVQIKGDALEKRSSTTALGALQGQTPGVQITAMSGQPGDGFKVLVRGVGTVGDSSPLYIVDGVQTGNISHINNSDIESIDVLKDAASTAIYGSQAANGVVLVTTKSGKAGKAQISFDAYYGLQNVVRKVDLLNTREYATIMNESQLNSGNAPYFTQDQINNMSIDTRWLDHMFSSDVPTQSYTLSAQGGSEKSVYSLSLGYTSQGGIVGGKDLSNYDRYSFRINTSHKLYEDIVRIGQHLTYTHVDSRGVKTGNNYSNTLRGALGASPFLPMYDDDGAFVSTNHPQIVNGEEWKVWHTGESNPYAMMIYENNNRNSNQKVLGDVYLEIEPIKNLKFRTTIGLDYSSSDYRSFTPIYSLSKYAENLRDKVSQSMDKGQSLSWDNVLSYAYDLNTDHHFSALVGTSARKYTGQQIKGNNADLSISDLDHAWLNNASNTDLALLSLGGYPYADEQLLSSFGRLNYNYKETYLVNATFRADGSSKFHKDNRWGYFPSVSLGWVASNESFMESTKTWLDYFKARASWGQVGNQKIPSFKYLGLVSTANQDYIFGNTTGADKNIPGAYPSTLPNTKLKWETSEQLDLGFDARFFGGKLNANFDWYHKTTKDWLIEVPVLVTSGVDVRYINGGDVVNKGIELGLSYTDRIGKDFQFTIAGNMSYNQNKVGKIPTEDGIIHGATNMLYDNAPEFYRAENGQPIGYFWGWQSNGIFQNQAEIDSYVNSEGKKIQASAAPGDLKYRDLDDDGKITNADKTNIGNPNPDITYGFTISCNFKNFDLAITTNGVAGNQIVQSYRNQTDIYANYTTRVLDRWHGEGTSNSQPRITNANINRQFSDTYIQDGDFFRISNITLGYDLSKVIKRNFLSQLRIYASVQNLVTFTKYDGMDPEIGFGNSSFSSGIDVGYYPIPRTFLMGVNVKF